MFSLMTDEMVTKFPKRHMSEQDLVTINNYLSDHYEQQMGENENPVTVDKISVDIAEDKENNVRVVESWASLVLEAV